MRLKFAGVSMLVIPIACWPTIREVSHGDSNQNANCG
jgi:hypothetical protein